MRVQLRSFDSDMFLVPVEHLIDFDEYVEALSDDPENDELHDDFQKFYEFRVEGELYSTTFDIVTPIKIIQIENYDEDDTDCTGDYLSVSLLILFPDGRKINMQFGDYYHDKGLEKAEAVVESYRLQYPGRIQFSSTRNANGQI